MKKLFLVIVAALFVSGCAINYDNGLFAKKKECAELRAGIEQRLEDLNNGLNSKTAMIGLDRIFYSPKQNTCMYTEERSSTGDDNVTRRTYTLYDAFSSKGIEQEFGCLPKDGCEKELMQASRDFDKLVEQYE